MLSMEAGGADVIELGVPFSDPIADGPAIQESNVVSVAVAYTALLCLDKLCTNAIQCSSTFARSL